MLARLVRALKAFDKAWRSHPYADSYLSGAEVKKISRAEHRALMQDPRFVHTGYYCAGESLLNNEVGYKDGVRYIVESGG